MYQSPVLETKLKIKKTKRKTKEWEAEKPKTFYQNENLKFKIFFHCAFVNF